MGSSDEPAIVARGIGKRYRMARGSGRLYDRVARVVSRADARAPGSAQEDLWALRDVSFEVPAGKVMGVLGRNGSGKTTLMKILGRITAPTEGTATVRGRVGVMLQVGIGFHPELTGRDNIGLSGAIMGMTASEIAEVEESIVDFAEIGRFLDQPVKVYSSGMFVRLAFAVSAHMTAEVLIIDEALSVGDAAFQQKCKERIHAMVREGRTVLFVSHSMSAIQDLCDSAIVLDAGRLVFRGPTDAAADHYEQAVLRLPPHRSWRLTTSAGFSE